MPRLTSRGLSEPGKWNSNRGARSQRKKEALSMSVKVEDKGHYELFETTNGNHVLVLNDERWFA